MYTISFQTKLRWMYDKKSTQSYMMRSQEKRVRRVTSTSSLTAKIVEKTEKIGRDTERSQCKARLCLVATIAYKSKKGDGFSRCQ